MQKLTQLIMDSPLASHVFTDIDIEQLLITKTDASRYAMLNKALKKNEIARLRRGLYALAQKYLDYLSIKWSKYYLAHRINPHSYVSAESALAYHQWIPERVTNVINIISLGRNKKFHTSFGEFDYYKMPLQTYEFYTAVDYIEINQQAYFMASPLRALMDFVYLHKLDWQGMNYLTDSLRIEEAYLKQIKLSEIQQLKLVYRSKRMYDFLENLAQGVNKL